MNKPHNKDTIPHKYLLLAEFSLRTVNYGPKNEANQMFIIWLLPIWGPETSVGSTI